MFINRKNYEKKYKRLKVFVTVLFLFLAYILYSNFDYLVFKYLITYNYAYDETLNTLYQNILSLDSEGKFFKNFDDVVISVVSEKIRGAGGDQYTYLYTPPQLEGEKKYTQERAALSEINTLSPGTAYMKLTNISKPVRELVYENRDFLKTHANLVMDLRGNGGGDLNQMYRIAELFLDKGDVISTEVARQKIFGSTAKAKKEKFFNFGMIYILQDNQTASAAEGLIMALKENLPNVTAVGSTSFGKGIGQITIPLKYSYAVKATVIRVLTPDGNSIHGVGIKPDIEYAGEDIIEFVRKQIEGEV